MLFPLSYLADPLDKVKHHKQLQQKTVKKSHKMAVLYYFLEILINLATIDLSIKDKSVDYVFGT